MGMKTYLNGVDFEFAEPFRRRRIIVSSVVCPRKMSRIVRTAMAYYKTDKPSVEWSST